MKNITLEVRESEYTLLLQFLRTLQYVKISGETDIDDAKSVSQLVLLQHVLNNQTSPLFKSIKDPLEWQKSVRDEWT